MQIYLSLKNRCFGGTQHTRGGEAYSHLQGPGAGDGWTKEAPHSGDAVHAQMWERGKQYHTELSWFVLAQVLS